MKLSRPSPALVIACLALFVSLGGVSYGVATGFIDSRELKNNTIRTQDLRNNDIRGKDVRNSSIQGRDVAFNTLTGSDISETRLSKVPDADMLDGVSSGGFLRSDAAGFAPITLDDDWSGVTDQPGPEFDVDPMGFVHLRGRIERDSADPTAFILPGGARPPADSKFIVWKETGVAQGVTIESDGDAVFDPSPVVGEDISLDGITYRAG